jgi:hypothetical protein
MTLKERLNKEELIENLKAKSHRTIKKNMHKNAKNIIKQKFYNNKCDIYDENKINKELKRPYSQIIKDINKKRILDYFSKIIKNSFHKNKKK